MKLERDLPSSDPSSRKLRIPWALTADVLVRKRHIEMLFNKVINLLRTGLNEYLLKEMHMSTPP